MPQKKAIFCWSGGKDSAMALFSAIQSGEWEICYLLTTVNGHYRRISMHGVREELLEAQADSIGIPLLKVYTYEASNAEYEQKMEEAFVQGKNEGIEYVIFGDIFLEDLRAYRENHLAKLGMKAVFPLWKSDTGKLIQDFLQLGFATITCCVNNEILGEEYAGEMINQKFISQLPANVDPCGENGEFHSFCFDGPLFRRPVNFLIDQKVFRPLEISAHKKEDSAGRSKTKGFWYCELLPIMGDINNQETKKNGYD